MSATVLGGFPFADVPFAGVATLVDQLTSVTALLQRADPRDRAEVYAQLGLRLTYDRTSVPFHGGWTAVERMRGGAFMPRGR